ncbi:discoidin domain-containing protein [Streptomyces caniscabiei]|uniref:discoidin domain-containing protein n=1 Tax=Streptomyces caniscabiei TaxID=2746961 RepID=UPI0029BF764E|nr:discoidin domain-containing protein [Streptomyces caniscabiei]MDX2599917.1 discoidin domain-containing protein [Streptomyces caniscabiei]MDX2734788.1 discoidin domain-containing protein [Streptomyces caniscabiei]MDX2779348.1 discoidin domain-containing protein [Streptomyces caniscabiei]
MPISRRSVLTTAAAGTGTLALAGAWAPAAAAGDAPERGSGIAGGGAGRLDLVDFGDADSEAAHDFHGPDTEVVDGHAGDRARVARPLATPGVKGGDLRFTVAVDPVHQNHLTVKFWGGDTSSYKTIAYINGEQIGYRRSGDYEALNTGTSRPLPGRFFYATIMLPLEHTRGRTRAEITLRTYDGAFSGKVTANSRGYYRAYTHTGSRLDLGDDPRTEFTPPTATVADVDDTARQALVDGYVADQVKLFDSLSAKVDATADGRLSVVRYVEELFFYAGALARASWCPAKTPAARKAALLRVFKCVDNHTKDYYRNTRLLAWGGHQGDWGGYYGALGQALYLVENVIADNDVLGRTAFEEFLDEPFVTGTEEGPTSLAGVAWDGGPLTRRAAWERVLKANFDYARSRLSYIYNQVMYTYEGAWEAHEGLRVIGSPYYEGRERSHRIVGEALGWEPFLGEEVLVGPDGQDLDLFHSLFQHDTTARWTDDYVKYVIKGLARSKLDKNGDPVRRLPLGTHYTTMTEAGHTRENGYVANYGEATNYLPEWFHRTWGHEGDEQLNDKILELALRNLHARSHARMTDLDDDLKRTMRMEMVVDERNTNFPGFPGYVLRISEGKLLHYVSLAHHIAEHPERYAGEQWSRTRRYAREAVGFAQQQIADHQYFANFSAVKSKNKYDLELGETWGWLKKQEPTGIVHPHTDFAYYTPAELTALGVRTADYERFAWVDVDCMFVSLRDGDTHLWGHLNERQRGFARNGRLHVRHPDRDHIVQLHTEGLFRYEDYWARMDNIDVDFMEDQQTGDSTALQALAGEIAPITFQPGVGTVHRENFEADHAYSGYPDLLTARYGRYLFAVNTTRKAYGNERTHRVAVPGGGTGVLDLVSGRRLPVRGGKVSVPPMTGLVLRLESETVTELPPSPVDFVHTLPGDGSVLVTWQTAAGATHYEVRRATRRKGPYELIAAGVKGRHFADMSVRPGETRFYTVTAVNATGRAPASYAIETELKRPASPGVRRTGWRDDALHHAREGGAIVRGSTVRVLGAHGDGLGEGDDYRVSSRDIDDALHFVNRPAVGGFTLTARVDGARGPATGLMLRDRLTADTRHVYFGADADGGLVLHHRTRDSRHDWQDDVRSPITRPLPGRTLAATPYLRLVRDLTTHRVHGQVSRDGRTWVTVGSFFCPFPYAVHAGVVATGDAAFAEVEVDGLGNAPLLVALERDGDTVTARWGKPDDALTFTLERSTDGDTWDVLAQDTRSLAHDDEGLRHGRRHYRVTAALVGGGTRVSEPAVAVAETFADVLARARATDPAGWTKKSHAAFTAELDRVEAETGKDEDTRIDAVYAAYELLVSRETLLRRTEVTASMVKASTIAWPGTGTQAGNGWRAFDGDPATYTDTLAADSWIDIDAGAGGTLRVDRLRVLPRAGFAARATGTVLRGSTDGGATWTDLHTIGATTDGTWYEAALPTTATYPLLRLHDTHNGRCNLTEVEFWSYAAEE